MLLQETLHLVYDIREREVQIVIPMTKSQVIVQTYVKEAYATTQLRVDIKILATGETRACFICAGVMSAGNREFAIVRTAGNIRHPVGYGIIMIRLEHEHCGRAYICIRHIHLISLAAIDIAAFFKAQIQNRVCARIITHYLETNGLAGHVSHTIPSTSVQPEIVACTITLAILMALGTFNKEHNCRHRWLYR